MWHHLSKTCHDNIGNRESYVTGEGTGSEEDFYYDSNQLNQYEQISLNDPPSGIQRLNYDADGNLTEIYVAGDVDCDGGADYDDIDCSTAAIGCPPTCP